MPVMRALSLLALGALLAGIDAKAADVFKCVTENGVVRYSATPCQDGDAQKLDIESRPTDPDAIREKAEQRQERIAVIDQARAEADKTAALAAEKKEQQRKACAAARERLQKLVAARRVTTGKGEDRRYLESEEIVARRQEAADRVNELCGQQ